MSRHGDGTRLTLTEHGTYRSRITAVCDAFDAMTSDRGYRQPIGIAAALEELEHCAGTQFDPAVVAAFCHAIVAPHAVGGGAPLPL